MATSGAFATSNDYIKYKITVTENSTSTANNTSNVTVKVNFYRTNTGYSTYGTGTVYCTIDGTTYSASVTSDQKITSSGINLFSKTLTISHSSDGSKSLTVSAYISHSRVTSSSHSYTVSLTKIARSSSITSAAAVTLGNAVSVKWTPANSSYAYKLKFVVGSGSYTTGYITPNTTSAYTYSSYTMATATWAPYITTAASATCTVYLYTYTSSSSSTSIGSSSKTFTVTVPSSVVPTCTATVSEGNSDIGLGVYLAGQSKLKVTVTATMSYSSAISSIVVKVGSNSYTASITTTSTGATGTITAAAQSATSVAVAVTVKDKRGRSGTYSTTVTQEPYSAPVINTLAVERCLANGTVDLTNGTYIKAVYQYTVSNVTGNGSSMTLKYKLQSDSTYKTLETETDVFEGVSTTYISTVVFSQMYSYDVMMTVTDEVTSTTKSVKVATALVVLHAYPDGTGIAFGKTAETSGIMETSWPIYVNSESAGGIFIKNKSDSGWTGVRATSWSGYDISLQVGSGGVNRGVYDEAAGNWLIYRNSSDNTIINNTTKVNAALTVTGILYVPNKGVTIANNYGVYHYLASGSSYAKFEWLNTSNEFNLGNTSYNTRIYGSSHIYMRTNGVVFAPRTSFSTSNTGRLFQFQINASETVADSETSTNAILCGGCDSTAPFIRSYATYSRTYSSLSGYEVVVTASGTFGRYNSSSARYKHDINYFDNADYASEDGLAKRTYTIDEDAYRADYRSILHLPVVQHQYNDGYITGEPDYDYSKYTTNFIAEDVAKICPAAAVYNADGEVESWDAKQFIPRIVAVLQEHERRLTAKEAL